MREEIFSKFKDYNKELEKILEKKDFSEDTKNLLLSMFYKLETSYNDYSIVKRKCKTKQAYLENILENIKNSNKIQLIKPNNSEFEILKEQNKLFNVDIKLKKIEVIANELAILSALLELNNFEIYLKEEYNLIRNSIPYLLNTAYEMENIEVLRDFNAWSWNTLLSEIKDININLIYQSLKIALDFDVFRNIQENNNNADVIELIKESLSKKYNSKVTEKFIELIFKISILIYINKSEVESKRLSEEKENLFNELEEIQDKKGYIEKTISEKKELTKRLKEIDLTLNNRELLFDEYEKRNNSLSEYNRIFSISHLEERMQRERQKVLDKIELCNKKIEPKVYLENKSKIEKDYNLLKNINFDKENNINKYINKLQIILLKDILLVKLEDITEDAELINYMYEFRYYKFIPYNEENLVKDIENFKEDIEKIEKIIIKKLYDKKLINTISTNEENDIKIAKNILNLKMINLEDVYLEIKRKEDKYIIKIYDGKETLEKEIKMDLEFNKKDKIKLNKKIKLFI